MMRLRLRFAHHVAAYPCLETNGVFRVGAWLTHRPYIHRASMPLDYYSVLTIFPTVFTLGSSTVSPWILPRFRLGFFHGTEGLVLAIGRVQEQRNGGKLADFVMVATDHDLSFFPTVPSDSMGLVRTSAFVLWCRRFNRGFCHAHALWCYPLTVLPPPPPMLASPTQASPTLCYPLSQIQVGRPRSGVTVTSIPSTGQCIMHSVTTVAASPSPPFQPPTAVVLCAFSRQIYARKPASI
jgi:hypothetical protein